MKTKKIEKKLTQMETNAHHTETTLEKVLSRLEHHEEKVETKFDSLSKLIYIGFGILIAVQFYVSNGGLKVGG